MTSTLRWHEAAVNDSAIPPRGDFTHTLFARGYLLSKKHQAAPVAHWRSSVVGSWYLTRDPRLAATFRSDGEKSLLLIGNAIDLRTEVEGAAVVDVLHRAWRSSKADLDEALEWLAGRYVILGQSNSEGFLQTDATGMLSASYSSRDQLISSHQNLLSEAAGGLDLSPFGGHRWLAEHNASTFPGTYTRFDGVRMLTANTELNLRDFSINRVGPLPMDRHGSEDAAHTVLDLMQRQLPFLARSGGGPMVSLTAGLDSRVTTAVMRPLLADSLFFTYERHRDPKNVSKRDSEVARELSSWLKLKHHSYKVRPLSKASALDASLEAILERNTFVSHGRSIAASYLRELPADRLHVRSNLYEIARAFYRSPPEEGIGARGFASLLTGGAVSSGPAVEAFDEMIATTGILHVDGYEPLDLFYWEHRMVSWFNKVLLESDIAHDTHIIVNSRVILRYMLSVSSRERREGQLLDRVIALAWPAVYDLPVNGRVRKLAL
ncbi:hypothetical protein [Microbacterium sp. USHLN186]|uniref:hypothetical protein n=1 Tax=Microbacterium sp. USHLN186 TaxID=3081286 RepID=UPI003016CDEB